MDSTMMAAMAGVCGPRVAGWVSAAAMLVVLIAHGVMPYLPVAQPQNAAWYRAAYAVLRLIAGNYRNAAPATPAPTPTPTLKG